MQQPKSSPGDYKTRCVIEAAMRMCWLKHTWHKFRGPLDQMWTPRKDQGRAKKPQQRTDLAAPEGPRWVTVLTRRPEEALPESDENGQGSRPRKAYGLEGEVIIYPTVTQRKIASQL